MSTAARLARLHEQAEGLFTSLSELRMQDARTGRDSDVFYGQCHALSFVGLIPTERTTRLDADVRAALQTFHSTSGDHHA
jgi:hypothetical protein